MEASDCSAATVRVDGAQLDGDHGALAGRAARGQRHEHQGPGRRDAERRVHHRRAGEDADALLVVREQRQLGAVQEGREVLVLGGLRDRAAGVAVDPPRAAAGLVQQVDGSGQGGVPYAGTVCRTDQRAGRGAQHVLASQGAPQPGEQADDPQQGQDEEHHGAAEDHGGLGRVVVGGVGHHEDGGDQAGQAEQHHEAPHAGQPDAAGDRLRLGHRRVQGGEQSSAKPTNQPAARAGRSATSAARPAAIPRPRPPMHQSGRTVGRPDDGEAEPDDDGEHQQVAEGVGAGGQRLQQVPVAVLHQGLDEHQPADLSGRHGDDEGVQQAVPVVLDAVALEGGDRAGEHGEGEQVGSVGVRRPAGVDQRHRLAQGQQRDPRRQQPPGQGVGDGAALGRHDERDGRPATDHDPDGGLETGGGQRQVGDGEQRRPAHQCSLLPRCRTPATHECALLPLVARPRLLRSISAAAAAT